MTLASQIAGALAEAGTAISGEALTAVLVKTVQPGDSPWDFGTASETEHELTAILRSYTARQVDGSSILAGDIQALLSAVGQRPEPGDKLTVGGMTYRVITVEPVAPSGVPLLYKAQIRR
ncbi:MAG: hypothetical protein RQ750_13300 [Roseovarius sp.]|nr:hypothetical protein [Roseovarius sp.]